MKHRIKNNILIPLLFFVILSSGCTDKDWRTASRDSAGIAPDPAEYRDAILVVYGAKAWSWRGWFAIHTWIAAKKKDQDFYMVYDVVGWRMKRGRPVLRIKKDIPDRYWYGQKPEVINEYKGVGVDELIDAVDKAARSYPWKKTYKVFPGPNSNTFTAWVAKKVPKLDLKLPFKAVGKGYAD